MGNKNYKTVNNVGHLIKLKDGKLACTYFKDSQSKYIIEIFTVDFKTELVIKIYDIINKIIQLKNGKLAVYVTPYSNGFNDNVLKIISLNEKNYKIEQIFHYNSPIKILEAQEYIVVNSDFVGFQFLKEDNNKYIPFKTISLSLHGLLNSIYLNNEEIICVYYNAIYFINIKEFKISYIFNISNEDQFIRVSLIRLNKKYALISFDWIKGTIYYIIDFLTHQIVSIIKSNVKINSLDKLSNDNIIITKWNHRKEFSLIFYKYDKFRLKKIKELPLNIELVHFVEYDQNYLVAYIQQSTWWDSYSYIGFVNINNNDNNSPNSK